MLVIFPKLLSRLTINFLNDTIYGFYSWLSDMAQRSRTNDVARKTNRCLKINRHFLLKWITRLGLGSTICFAMYLYRTLEDDIMLLSGNNEVEKNIGNCPPNYSLVKDNVLPDEVTHANRKIPSVIHFFVRSKCLPVELTDYMHHWTSLTNYTILFHDEEEIHNHLSKERSDLPFLPDAFRCAVKHEAILDLARTVFLYDFGGYSVDIDHIPGPEFLHGGHFMHSPHQYGAQRKHQDFYGWENYEFLMEEDQAKSPYPHFLASEPRHMVTHITMMISIGFQSLQFTNASVTRVYDQIGVYWQLYNYLKMFNGEDHNETVTKKWYGKFGDKAIRIGIIRESRMVGDLFVKLNLTNAAKESVRLREIPPGHCSVDLLNDSYRVDVKSLLNITGKYGDEDTGVSCPDGQVYVSNTFRPESIVPGRKIPKIIHMTSKTKCFTKAFADNIHRWRFEGYSLLIHDDPAVERLLNKHWPEFPLLKNVRSCIFYGAALADIWRYLVIWEYGGVYTDVDDAPGQLDVNGTMIKDEDDAYFEVERSGLPSQYYFAGEMKVLITNNYSFV